MEVDDLLDTKAHAEARIDIALTEILGEFQRSTGVGVKNVIIHFDSERIIGQKKATYFLSNVEIELNL